jgi:hypothetical protein
MSGVAKKLMSAAGAGGGFTAIEDVFSTYLYTGNNTSQTINNGIDLAGEGGLVWIQERDDSSNSYSYVADSERGSTKYLITQVTNAEGTQADAVTSFNSDGFTLGVDSIGRVNVATGSPLTGRKYASWTFRKAPRFFDCVEYTGTGVAGLEIAHDLGVDPGFIVVKKTSDTGFWRAFHRSLPDHFGNLNLSSAFFSGAAAIWGNGSVYVAPTSTNFTVGSDHNVNSSGQTYVAYLFAHDPLGPSGDGSDGLIACGSFTDSSSGWSVDLGFEPQFLLTKRTDSAGNWEIVDTVRDFTADRIYTRLYPNLSNAEQTVTKVGVNSTGFFSTTAMEVDGATIIYIAIRRGPMRAPTSGTEVFDPEVGGASVANNALVTTTGFPVDMFMHFDNYTSGGETFVVDRLRGRGVQLRTQYTATEATYGTNDPFLDSNEGLINRSGSTQNESGGIFWSFRRAPEFFDAVAYSGNGVAGRTVPHNLGVAPEMMIVKNRTSDGGWLTYAEPRGISKYLFLNQNSAETDVSAGYDFFFSTSPTATDFTVNSGFGVNGSGQTFIAYLFATLAGVSKVGSYTGNGSSQTINCGFTSGARFILIKRTDSTGDWYVWDTARGIVAGNDPFLELNTTDAEVTSDDSIDPDSSGFIVNQTATTNVNVSSASYIFLAIA